MNLFSATDVFKFAIRIEEDGELFYQRAATFADTDEVRKLFLGLADEEIRHKRVFTEMLEKVGDYRPVESYPGEYMAYLRDYIDGKAIFTKSLKEASTDIHDVPSALNFAIKRELDSILYYQEIKNFVPEKYHSNVEAIVAEERKHFAKLSDALRNYLKKKEN